MLYLLTLNEREVAEVGVIRVSGEPALGFYRLEVTVEVLPKRKTLNIQSIARFGGELLLKATAGGRPLPLASLQPYSNGPTSLPWNTDGERLYLYLVADLDRSRLDALEEIRAGRDIIMTVRLNVELQEGVSTNGAVLLMDHPLKRDAWIEILKNVGYAEKILMEFPSLPRA